MVSLCFGEHAPAIIRGSQQPTICGKTDHIGRLTTARRLLAGHPPGYIDKRNFGLGRKAAG